MVTKIQLAAMSRSDIERVDDRRPFYLYVDEFQNFATDSFATILSEARKYGLNLTVANQYVAQMSETVRDAVFGNVGTMITMRVSAEDSPILAKQFEPLFEPNDLLQMHNRHFIMNMVIQGEKSQPFSATTLSLPPAQTDYLLPIVENTRAQFARPRTEVEAEIADSIAPPINLQSKAARRADARAQAAVGVGVNPQAPVRSPNGVVGTQTVLPKSAGANGAGTGNAAANAAVPIATAPPISAPARPPLTPLKSVPAAPAETSKTTKPTPAAAAATSPADPPKRKRTRSRKKKTDDIGTPNTQAPAPAATAPLPPPPPLIQTATPRLTNDSDSGSLRLR
jgi:hypothetical protein